MSIFKFMIVLLILFISLPVFSFANGILYNKSVEFFASNNTSQIDFQDAFKRLKSVEQRDLKNSIIVLMQRNHLEQGRFEGVLGAYQLSSMRNFTADNTEIFFTSPYQKLSKQKIFSLAKRLAKKLKQEDIALFIPSFQYGIGDVVVKFKVHHYSIKQVVALIHKKLPKRFSKAFSLHLQNTCYDFNKVNVQSIEWLGSNIKTRLLKKIFPQADLFSYHGIAYLVYKNGKEKRL